MSFIIITVFLLGYLAITLEQVLKIDKLIPALLMMCVSWILIALGIDYFDHWYAAESGTFKTLHLPSYSHEERMNLLENTLLHHFGKTAEILIFLMGAMVIVEMIDHFQGFDVFKNLIKTRKKFRVLLIFSALSFCLSAIIDNLTGTIVMITVLRKITIDRTERLWMASFVIISANAGGAWSPVGDVTTTMLWMADKVSTGQLASHLILPSLANILIPLVIASYLPIFKGKLDPVNDNRKPPKYGLFMLVWGLILIVAVPIFKMITHLPPYLGMMLSLALFSLLAELISNRTISFTRLEGNAHLHQSKGPTLRALSKIELPSILFFLGILMTIAALETLGTIDQFSVYVRSVMSDKLFVSLLGLCSAVLDNVPLVAACMGMFTNELDAEIWHLVAYASGTGGSLLIIGSAAGVVAMGMEKISFMWYLRNIAPLALAGYLGGLLLFEII